MKNSKLNIIIEPNSYTLSTLYSLLKISSATGRRRRKDIEDQMKLYFLYIKEEKNGRVTYHIIQQYQPWCGLEPPEKVTIEEKTQFYKEKTFEILETQPLNSISNIARIIFEKYNKFGHKESTMQKYIGPIVNSNYENINKRMCKLDKATNEYIPMTSEEINTMIDFRNQFFQEYEKEVGEDIYNRLNESLNNLDDLTLKKKTDKLLVEAMKHKYRCFLLAYFEQFDYVPVYVGEYTKKQGTGIEEEYSELAEELKKQ